MHKLWPRERLLRSLPVPATKIVGALVAGALLAGGGTIAAVHTLGHKANTTVDLSSGAAAGNGAAGAPAGGRRAPGAGARASAVPAPPCRPPPPPRRRPP